MIEYIKGDIHEVIKTLDMGHLRIFASSSLDINFAKDGASSYSDWTTTGTTNSGYEWHREEMLPFSDSTFKELSLEVRGTGKWILHDVGLDLSSGSGTQLQVI